MCDADELIYITEEELKEEATLGYNIIKFTGYNILNKTEKINLNEMKEGFRDTSYDKYYLFNKSIIKDMNYSYGCHARDMKMSRIKTTGQKVNLGASKDYKAINYKFISLDYTLERQAMYDKRRSHFDLNVMWGGAKEEVKHLPDSWWIDMYKKDTIKLL